MLTTTRLYNEFKTHVDDSVVSQTEFIRILNKVLHEMGITKPAEQIYSLYYCKGWGKYDLPTDFRSPISLTNENDLFMKYLSPFMYRLKDYSEMWTEQSDNATRYLIVQHRGTDSESTLVTACDDIDDDGVWSGTSGIDTAEYKEGSGSVTFTTSGTQTTVTFIRTNVIDVSEYTNQLRERFYLRTPTAPSNIKVRYGNDASNYMEQTLTTQVSGEPFSADVFNELELSRSDATETGTVDHENIDWFQFELNFASSISQSGFLIDNIELIKPERLDLEYYSSYVGIDSDGLLTEKVTETSDTPSENPVVKSYPDYITTILDGCGYYFFRNRGPENSKQYRRDYIAKHDPYNKDLISGLAYLEKKYPDRTARYRRSKRLPDLNTGFPSNYYTS